MVEDPNFRCPRCLGELELFGCSLRCRSCHAAFPVNHGITDFRCSRDEHYCNSDPPPQMEQLIRNMTASNWAETIRTLVMQAKEGVSYLDDLVVDGRYAWKLLLDLNPEAVLLDVGCGFGTRTRNLAPFVRRVYAMDLTYARVEFSKRRFDIFNPGDDIVPVVAGDSEHLPFRDSTLDCVVLSGVLKWGGDDRATWESPPGKLWRMVSGHFGRTNPRRVQLRFLREIRRVLKPSGQVFIAIENRFGYENFRGSPDDDSGPLLCSLLPRLAANLYSIAVKRIPYRNYIYSIPGYRRLLREAGFADLEFLGFSQSYRSLERITPAAVDLPIWRPDPPRTFKESVRRNKYLVPAYGIIASSAPRPWRRLQDEMFLSIDQQLNAAYGPAHLVLRRYDVSWRDKLLVTASYGSRRIIIRIPLNAAAVSAEKRNVALLRSLDGIPSMHGRYPVHLASGQSAGLWYSVEEFLAGEPLVSVLPMRERTSMLASVAELLDSLNPPRLRCAPCQFTGQLYEREVTQRLDTLFQVVPEQDVRNQVERYFRERLQGVDVTVGLFHGDFGTRNIFVNDSNVCSLIDWEGGATDGLPILDAISYLGSVHMVFSRKVQLAQLVELIASETWPVAEEWTFLRARYAALGMGRGQHTAWTYLYWLHCVGMLLKDQLIYSASGIESKINTVLRSMISATNA